MTRDELIERARRHDFGCKCGLCLNAIADFCLPLLAQAREELLDYAQHGPSCPQPMGKKPCDCGLDAILRRAPGETEKP